MFTARDVRKRLKEINLCEGIDDWIESVLVSRFATKRSVKISDREITWDKDSFVSSMRQRGFLVVYYCEDRPCGGCWYEIILPPGVE